MSLLFKIIFYTSHQCIKIGSLNKLGLIKKCYKNIQIKVFYYTFNFDDIDVYMVFF